MNILIYCLLNFHNSALPYVNMIDMCSLLLSVQSSNVIKSEIRDIPNDSTGESKCSSAACFLLDLSFPAIFTTLINSEKEHTKTDLWNFSFS